jgi:proteasome alpha subunit
MMGYDRAITMFSPDGRLLQVEYAKKTVRQGSLAIGISCKDGVVLVADKRIMDTLIVPESVEKIWQIDNHMIAAASGIISDARVLIDRAQLKAQQHRVTYDTEIDMISIVRDMCDLMQMTTQSGGLRPFGVSMLIAGVDGKQPKLFETDPTGIYFQYKAAAIGEGETEVEEILKKEYRDDITMEDGLKLAIKSLKKVLGPNFGAEKVEASFVSATDKKSMQVDKAKIERIAKEFKDEKPAAPKKA